MHALHRWRDWRTSSPFHFLFHKPTHAVAEMRGAEALRVRAAVLARHGRRQRLEPAHRVGNPVRGLLAEKESRDIGAYRLRDPTAAKRDDRRSARLRFDGRNTKILFGREHERPRTTQQFAELRAIRASHEL